jgi:catechol 2,3-dioxygenase-like lactoylglutathione lyase family enzyme
MKAKGIAHIAMCVRDLEQSLTFYRDLLGTQVTLHATQEMAMPPYESACRLSHTS